MTRRVWLQDALFGAGCTLLVGAAIGVGLGASLADGAPAPAPTHTVEVEVPAAIQTGTCRDVALTLHDLLVYTSDEVDLDVHLAALDPTYQRCINP